MTAASMSDHELFERIERVVWPSDRTFFEHHPTRRFRVRPAFSAEIEQFARLREIECAPPAGFVWWVAVHKAAPGVRLRAPLQAPHDMSMDVPEADARRVWQEFCPPGGERLAREIKARWKKAAR